MTVPFALYARLEGTDSMECGPSYHAPPGPALWQARQSHRLLRTRPYRGPCGAGQCDGASIRHVPIERWPWREIDFECISVECVGILCKVLSARRAHDRQCSKASKGCGESHEVMAMLECAPHYVSDSGASLRQYRDAPVSECTAPRAAGLRRNALSCGAVRKRGLPATCSAPHVLHPHGHASQRRVAL